MNPQPEIKRGRGRPSKITRDIILTEARKLTAGKLSMPALAKILHVKTPALYHHFSSREDLVLALSQIVLEEMEVKPADPVEWRRWLRDANMDLYHFILQHPLIVEVGGDPEGYLSSTLPLCEAGLETLQRAGFDNPHSYWILLSLTQLTTAAARSECDGRTTEKVHQDVAKLPRKKITVKPRTGEMLTAITLKTNAEWLGELLDWTISCLPDPA